MDADGGLFEVAGVKVRLWCGCEGGSVGSEELGREQLCCWHGQVGETRSLLGGTHPPLRPAGPAAQGCETCCSELQASLAYAVACAQVAAPGAAAWVQGPHNSWLKALSDEWDIQQRSC